MKNWLNNYFEKGLGAKSVFLFMVLLTVSGILLIFKLEKNAEYVANAAYLFLLIGGTIRALRLLSLN